MAGSVQVDDHAARIVLDDVRGALVDLSEPARVAGQQLIDLADPHAPRLTGALAESITVVDATPAGTAGIGSPLDYFGPVHTAQPWLAQTAAAAGDQWADPFRSHLTKEIP